MIAFWVGVVLAIVWTYVLEAFTRWITAPAEEPVCEKIQAESGDYQMVAVCVAGERYVFVFLDTPANRHACVATARRYAADPELVFSAACATAVAEQLMEPVGDQGVWHGRPGGPTARKQ